MKHGGSSKDEVDDDEDDDDVIIVEGVENSPSASEDAKPAPVDEQVRICEFCGLLKFL